MSNRSQSDEYVAPLEPCQNHSPLAPTKSRTSKYGSTLVPVQTQSDEYCSPQAKIKSKSDEYGPSADFLQNLPDKQESPQTAIKTSIVFHLQNII